MNIAVVTIYDGLNYGSFLQAYAMKAYLEARGHHTVFVQRMTEEENLAFYTTNKPEGDCGRVKKLWRTFRRTVLYGKKYRNELRYYRRQFPYYQAAWGQLLLKNPEHLDHIDCIVCGSDEIWNLNNVNIDASFYTCTDYGDNITKIAVAVSVGNATRELFREHPQVEEAIRGFSQIIVRDRNSMEIVRDITGRTPEMVCDPTLLVDRSVFQGSGRETAAAGRYLFVYTYGLTEGQSRIVRDYAQRNHMRIISACSDLKIADQTVYASPLEFAELIANAECCFTTTFHGTVFSVLFAKRFCTIAKYPKIADLVSAVGADAHLWDGEDRNVFEKIMKTDADRELLDRKLEELKERSSAIIDQALDRVLHSVEK